MVEVLPLTNLTEVWFLFTDRLLVILDGSRALAIQTRHRTDRVSGFVECLRLSLQAFDKTVREENTVQIF